MGRARVLRALAHVRPGRDESFTSAQESIDLDRSRKVTFGRLARKPAPMLVLHRLTVEMTVKVGGAAASA
jgi:hypothetical protein